MADNPHHPPLQVLCSVYACGPDWGSEVGMGWNWVYELSAHCQLTVITEAGFKESIERRQAAFDGRFKPEFHYIAVPEVAREAFWHQGAWQFYPHYKRWQKQALALARQLVEKKDYDIVHQLNMVGFREPGYLWQLPGNFKYIWGPISGMYNPPPIFWQDIPLKNRAKLWLKRIINSAQAKWSPRICAAIKRADEIVAVTNTDKEVIKRYHQREAVQIAETGTRNSDVMPAKNVDVAKLNLVWCGVMEARKALPLALAAIAQLPPQWKVELHVIGNGDLEKHWRQIADNLNLSHKVFWHGRIPHDKMLKLYSTFDALLLSSWEDATTTVVPEALSSGTPVICHDCCGMGGAITEYSGIKIPLVNPQVSIAGFKDAISRLYLDIELRQKLSQGAWQRSNELSWAHNVEKMLQLYYSSGN